MDRRQFIRLAGGGVVIAAAAPVVSGCSQSSDFPPEAIEAWQGPKDETDPRRWALAHAITAPNPHNLQPWIADLREPQVITIRTDPERVLAQTDPQGRQILIGHGAFLELLVMALAEKKLRADVALWPEGELDSDLKTWDRRPIARIEIKPWGRPDPLFSQVLKRHTPKSDFDIQRTVERSTLDLLLGATQPLAQGLAVDGTTASDRLEALRSLCWQSAQVELLTPRTVMESIHLTRVGPSEILEHRDGISLNGWKVRMVNALGLFDRQSPPVEGSEAYKTMMSRFEGHSRTAMGFVWLSGGNRRSDQIAAGRAYLRMQLKATQLGVGIHPMSQALQEFPEMAPHYERAHQLMLGKPAPKSPSDPTLQMFCRVGYPMAEVPATPRRPLQAFLQT